MRKFLVLLFLFNSFYNIVNAETLVLSDIIQQAREAVKMQEAKDKAELAMMQKTATNNNETKQESSEQNACDKTSADKS